MKFSMSGALALLSLLGLAACEGGVSTGASFDTDFNGHGGGGGGYRSDDPRDLADENGDPNLNPGEVIDDPDGPGGAPPVISDPNDGNSGPRNNNGGGGKGGGRNNNGGNGGGNNNGGNNGGNGGGGAPQPIGDPNDGDPEPDQTDDGRTATGDPAPQPDWD